MKKQSAEVWTKEQYLELAEKMGFDKDIFDKGIVLSLSGEETLEELKQKKEQTITFSGEVQKVAKNYENLLNNSEKIKEIFDNAIAKHQAFLKEIDDAIKRLISIVGMQGRDAQMTRLCKGNSVLHGLAIADFTNQNHIRGLAQSILQCVVPTARVDADLALINDRALVTMDEFDRVFHGDDMASTVGIAVINHGR